MRTSGRPVTCAALRRRRRAAGSPPWRARPPPARPRRRGSTRRSSGPPAANVGEALCLAHERVELGLLAVLRVEEVAAHGVARPEDLDPGHVAAGEVAAERHERGRAAGQLRERLGAVDVAGRGVRVGARWPGDRVDRRELLAAEPADLVELVHAHVPKMPPLRARNAALRRLAVPLEAGEQVDLAELARVDSLAAAPGAPGRSAASSATWKRHAVAFHGLLRPRGLPALDSPQGFSHRIGSPAAATCVTSSMWRSLGAAISTPSMPPAARSSRRPRTPRAPSRRSPRVASATGSTTAVTATVDDPASARRWVRPMRPGADQPEAEHGRRSQPALVQELAVGALVRCRPLEALLRPREGVLLHDEPAAIADPPERRR